MIPDINPKIGECIAHIPRSEFSTTDVIQVFKERFPDDWRHLVERFGEGGKGSGLHYSAHNYMGRQTRIIARKPDSGIHYLGVTGEAPPEWGGEKIALFRKANK